MVRGMETKSIDDIKLLLLKDILKCSYCGFCEWVCPTLNIKEAKRIHSPRGRVNTIIFALRENLWTKAGLEGIYSCLLCQACSIQCPAGIDIERDIRLFRHYINTVKTLF